MAANKEATTSTRGKRYFCGHLQPVRKERQPDEELAGQRNPEEEGQ
jgi:hypothetical protein